MPKDCGPLNILASVLFSTDNPDCALVEWNLKFSSVLLSLLTSNNSTPVWITCNLQICNWNEYLIRSTIISWYMPTVWPLNILASVMFSDWHPDCALVEWNKSENLECDVLYLPPTINSTCQSMKSDIQIITFTWNLNHSIRILC